MKYNWKKKRIEQCFKVKSGAFLPANKMAKEGSIDVYGGNGIAGKHDQYNLTGENIVIGRVGAKCGNVKYVNGNIWITDNAFYISEFLEEFDLRFLEHLLNTKNLRNTANQTAQPVISYKTIKNIILIVPPLHEQKRIVAILDEAFEGIDRAIANAEKNLANSRELFESYLNAIFTQKGDGWITTTVGELVERDILEKPLDGNHGEIHPKKSDFVKSGVPFIMASDLIDGVVDQVNCNFITLEQANSLRKGFAKYGDVLLSHKGTIGRAAVLKTSHPNVVLTPQVTYYRVIDNSVLYNRYLYYFFHSPSFQDQIKTIAGAGSTRAYIGITSQLQLEISHPKIDDQKRYADSFDALISETQRLEAIYRQKITALNELKQSILQKAFTGELTADTPKVVKEKIAA
jgi:type I restriction enzyme S subunit